MHIERIVHGAVQAQGLWKLESQRALIACVVSHSRVFDAVYLQQAAITEASATNIAHKFCRTFVSRSLTARVLSLVSLRAFGRFAQFAANGTDAPVRKIIFYSALGVIELVTLETPMVFESTSAHPAHQFLRGALRAYICEG